MSAGVSTSPVAAVVAHHRPRAAHSDASVSLSGTVDGDYTSTQKGSHAATKYKLTAEGSITPIGQAAVTGSFRTSNAIRIGEVAGRLKIVGSQGTLILKLQKTNPVIAGALDLPSGFNPGGPIKGLRPSSGASPSASGEPVILVNDFNYSIVKGTGQYAHDTGTGTGVITTTPNTAIPPGPGIYSSPMATESGFGQTTVNLYSGPVPL
jgi:hypothetical protein